MKKNSQKILAVSGVKNSGKTTLIEKLLPLLTGKGLDVAVIKHDGHCFVPDVANTDSFRFREAGACGVAIFDSRLHMVIKKEPIEIKGLISEFPGADLILLEGFKNSSYPKIEIVRDGNSCEPVCREAVLAVATNIENLETSYRKLNLNDENSIADFILQYRRLT